LLGHRLVAHVLFAEDDELPGLVQLIGQNGGPGITDVPVAGPTGFVIELRDRNRIPKSAGGLVGQCETGKRKESKQNRSKRSRQFHWILLERWGIDCKRPARVWRYPVQKSDTVGHRFTGGNPCAKFS